MSVVRDVAVVAGRLLSLFMGLVLLVAGLVLAAFVFITSSVGESWLTGVAQQALAKQAPGQPVGVTFTALRGPFTERLVVEGLRLTDEKGGWLSVESLTLVPDWKTLWEQRRIVAALTLQGPRFERLPVFPSDPTELATPEVASGPLKATDLTDWLNLLPVECPPLAVALTLRDGALGAAVLGGVATLEQLAGATRVELTPRKTLNVETLKIDAVLMAGEHVAAHQLPDGLLAQAQVSLTGKALLVVDGAITSEGRLGVQTKEDGSLKADWLVSPATAQDQTAGLVAKLTTQLEASPKLLNSVLPAGLLPSGMLPSGVEVVSAPLSFRATLGTELGTTGWTGAKGTVDLSGGVLGDGLRVAGGWDVDPARLVVSEVRFEALGLGLTGQATVPFAADFVEDFAEAWGDLSLQVRDWKVLGRVAHLMGLPGDYAPLLMAKSLRTDVTLRGADLRATLALDGWDERMEPLRLQASLRLPDGTLSAKTSLAFPLAMLRRLPQLAKLAGLAELPDGQLRAEAQVAGTLWRPDVRLKLTVDAVRLPGLALPDIRVELASSLTPADGLSVQGLVSGVSSVPASLTARVAVPYGASGPAFSEKAALSGRLNWNGPLADWWRLVPVTGQRVKGTGVVRLDVTGTLTEPILEGEVSLRDGSWDDRQLGVAVSPVTATLLWQGGDAKLQLEAGDGRGGRFTAKGHVNGPAKGFTLAAQGELYRFAPLRRNDVRVVISGTTTLAGTVFAPDVRADLTVDEGGVRLANLPGAGIAEFAVTEKKNAPAGSPVMAPATTPPAMPPAMPPGVAPVETKGALDINVHVPGRFFVRGRGIDSEWRGQVAVDGPLASPRVTGELSSVRGTLDLLGKTFVLAVGRLVLDGQQPPNPALDIVLRYTIPTLVAEATVSGSVERPRLTLSSQPVLPQDEVVAQVLFGTSVAELNSAQAVQLAASVAALAGFGDGGAGLLNSVRRVLGVDVLRVGAGAARAAQRYGSNKLGLVRDSRSGGEEDSAGSLEAGKYLSDKVYVGVEQGLGPDSGAVRMEVELTPNISLEARTSSKASDIGINWKKNY